LHQLITYPTHRIQTSNVQITALLAPNTQKYLNHPTLSLLYTSSHPLTPVYIVPPSSQIESWMDNTTLTTCSEESLSGGAVPQNSGALYYGMVAPFANYSVRGWLWYQVLSGCETRETIRVLARTLTQC
jgi:hypothetical protein